MKFWKSPKNRNFPNRLYFLSIKGIFSHGYFLEKLSQKRLFFDILDRNECSLGQKSEVLKKSKTSTFFKVVCLWSFLKNRIFSYRYILDKWSEKRLYFYVLDRKECFLDQKNDVLKKPKKSKFSKGVSPWFL